MKSRKLAGFLVLGIMFYLYILYSKSLDQYYIGHSENLEDRLYGHNNSGSKSIKKANDWIVVYKEEFLTRSEAMKREIEIDLVN